MDSSGWIRIYYGSYFDVLEIKPVRVDGKDQSLNVPLTRRPMYGATYMMSLLGDTSKVMVDQDKCVANVLWYAIRQIQEKGRLKKVTKQQVLDQLGEHPTAERLTEVIKSIGYISSYGFNGFGELVISNTVDCHSQQGYLVYIIMNDHMYPVYDESMKLHASKCKKLDLQYTVRNLEFTDHMCISEKDFNPFKDYNKPVVLVQDAAHLDDMYMRTHQELQQDIPQLSMDGDHITEFVHPRNNIIFSAADDYADRKYVCDYIYNNIFKDGGFLFQNQSWRTIATSSLNFVMASTCAHI